MANYCNYEMKVDGRKENVEEFINIIQADYYIDKNKHCNCDRHFWRVFEADVYERVFKNGEHYAIIGGYCAWSVLSCMCDGADTYNNSFPNLGGTSLQKESERLQLSIEVFSEEPGCAFMEHFVYNNGECIIDDCVDYHEYDTLEFETVEELNAEFGTNFTEKDFEHNDVISDGGIDWIYDEWR